MTEAKEEVKAVIESKGVKETLEFVEGLKIVVPAGVEVLADGKLSSKDIKPVVEVVKQYQVIVDAVKGVDLVIPEVKDLDTIELAQIGAAVLEVFKASQAAYAAGK